jgi:DNA/RNA-binding domain of Phe-tRNA-synthetase-like protein
MARRFYLVRGGIHVASVGVESVDFKVEGRVLSAYPRVKIGVLVGRGLVVGEGHPGLEACKGRVVAEAVERMGSEPVTKQPFIASWRDMYRSFGTRPGDYRPSSEALLRRVLKRGALPTINSAVDAYNALSVRHLIPMGGFDLDRTRGDISLRLSEGGEVFNPLGSSGPEETYEGEPVYADESRILTRRWNFRDCDETKITTETRNLVMFVDGSGEIPRKYVDEALRELSDLLGEYCGGDYRLGIADVSKPQIPLR